MSPFVILKKELQDERDGKSDVSSHEPRRVEPAGSSATGKAEDAQATRSSSSAGAFGAAGEAFVKTVSGRRASPPISDEPCCRTHRWPWTKWRTLPLLRRGTSETASLAYPSVRLYPRFCGQNRDFGVMLPTGLRGKRMPGDAIWNCYSWHLGIDLKRHEPECEIDDDVLNFCVRAMAQHYGPGSEFLDVTRSKGVALWFALNEFNECKVACPVDPPPKLLDAPYALTRSGSVDVWRYRPTASGVLYVFLVPEWDGVGRPGHGHVIDLPKRAPRPFTSSERIRIRTPVCCRQVQPFWIYPVSMRVTQSPSRGR